MPNFHPQLVATVAPFLESGEEVWAVYPSKPRSLVATATRLFLVSPVGTSALPLGEFELMRRPRPSLVLLQRRAGGVMRIAVDPLDEHGIQALTVIGLLVANIARPHAVLPDEPAPARAAPAPRHRLATHRFVLRDGRSAVTAKRGWTTGWAASAAPPMGPGAAHRGRFAFRLGRNRAGSSG